MKKNAFIDISVLKEFSGNLTGISRTIYNVVRHLILNHSNELQPQFLSFSKSSASHNILSYSEFLRVVESIHPEDLPEFQSKLQQHLAAQTFGREDWLLVLGEQWLYPDSMLQITKLKELHGFKIASFIHDLIPFMTRQFHWEGFTDDFEKCILATVKISEVLLCNSESTKADLLRVVKAQGITLANHPIVVRLGDNFFTDQMIRNVTPVEESDYILCVGTIQPRKNHLLLAYVWKMLVAKLGASSPSLVILGNRGWHVDDLLYFVQHDPELRTRVTFRTRASDQQLVSYYKNSLFTVFPSFYEGWGLPVAESASLGKFCIASNSSSMPEIAGDLIDYHNPYDSGDLYNKILKYIENRQLLSEKEARLKLKYRTTTWSEFTQQLVKTLTD